MQLLIVECVKWTKETDVQWLHFMRAMGWEAENDDNVIFCVSQYVQVFVTWSVHREAIEPWLLSTVSFDIFNKILHPLKEYLPIHPSFFLDKSNRASWTMVY